MSSNIKIRRVCQHCKNEFEAQKTTTKFCSHKCASRAYKENLRNLKVELSNKETETISTQHITELQAKEFLSINESCNLIGISRRTLYRILKRGEIKAGKFGKRTIIRRSDIDKIFVLAQNHNTQPIEEEKQKQYDITDCYSTLAVRKKYGISESALRNLVIKHKIPKYRKGLYAYVPRPVLDKLLS